ncbi:hypothetical protein [Halorubrum sp. HHNYT27]|uniref:hypothetical protein n=1 Tax=Halorubrum sp. HHNYT27 TaxID=3402275 RepID=UPI003EBCB288
MNARETGVTSRIEPHGSVEPTDLVRLMESETETITGAVAAGAVTLGDLDRFVQSVERGEVDCCGGTDAVVRILRSLLSDRRPNWEEMASAGLSTVA